MPTHYKSYIIPFVEIGAKLLSIVAIFIITRLLSQEEFGEFNYINSIVLIFSILLDLGINSKAYTLSLQNKLIDLSKLYYTRIFLSTIVLILFNFIILFFTDLSLATIGVYSIVIWLTSFIAFLKLISRGRGFYRMDVVAIIIEPFLKIILLVLVFLQINNLNLDKLYLLLLLASGIGTVVVLFKVRSYFKFNLSSNFFKWPEIQKTIFDTRHFIFYYVFLVAIQRIEIFFIKERLDFVIVAIYFSAFNLILAIQVFLRSSVTSRYKQYIDGKIGIGRVSLELGSALFVIMFISFFTIPWVFNIVYPVDYISGIPVFRVLLLILPFYLMNTFFINHFNVNNSPHINTIVLGIIFVTKLIVLLSVNFLNMANYAWLSVGFEVMVTISYGVAILKKQVKKSMIIQP